jgi:arylsulfatase A-like enzyme
VTEAAVEWIDAYLAHADRRPFFLWVHYVDPHAPYDLHRAQAQRLGLPSNPSRQDRYDTEVAFVDDAVGHLLDHVRRRGLDRDTLVVFSADHGESLGEHDYWGHGRNLYEPTLRIPLAIRWPGRVPPGVASGAALLLDIAPTVLGLAGIAPPASFRGFDWSDVLTSGAAPPVERLTTYQAHRGAVLSKHDSDLARQSGLLQVGIIRGSSKEIFHVRDQRTERFDLAADPHEANSLDAPKSRPSEGILSWMKTVYDGLGQLDDAPLEPLDAESAARLRSLGYVD